MRRRRKSAGNEDIESSTWEFECANGSSRKLSLEVSKQQSGWL